eukprot:jgi/Chlat1/2563/Chrsp175S02412
MASLWRGSSGGEGAAVRGASTSAEAAAAAAAVSEKDKGWLMRLFGSEYFSDWMAIQYLYRACVKRQSGVKDFLCNRLYTLSEEQVERFLAQLVVLVIDYSLEESDPLQRYLVNLCGRSLRVGVKTCWLVTAACEDRPHNTELARVRARCLRHALNARWTIPWPCIDIPHSPRVVDVTQADDNGVRLNVVGQDGTTAVIATTNTSQDCRLDATTATASRLWEGHNGAAVAQLVQGSSDMSAPLLVAGNCTASQIEAQQAIFTATSDFVKTLCDLSTRLVNIYPVEDRRQALQQALNTVNHDLASRPAHAGVCFLLGSGVVRVVQIAVDETVLLNSRDKAPYMVFFEVLRTDVSRQARTRCFFSSSGSSVASVPAQLILDSLASITGNGNNGQQVEEGQPRPPASHNSGMQSRSYSAKPPLPPSARRLVEEAAAGQAVISSDGAEVIAHAIDVAMAGLQSNIGESQEVEVVLRVVDGNRPSSPDLFGGSASGYVSEPTTPVTPISPPDSPHRARFDEGATPYVRCILRAPASPLGPEVARVQRRRGRHNRVPSSEALAQAEAETLEAELEQEPARSAGHSEAPTTSSHAAGTVEVKTKHGGIGMKTGGGMGMSMRLGAAVAGERFADKMERIRASSPFGSSPAWDLRSAIVKSGDDCRQELLAVQLIYEMHSIFAEEKLPLWLRPYGVLVISARTALIETIVDSASIHAIKSRTPSANIRDHFIGKYGQDTPAYRNAQRNFVESMAGYSIFCYLMQVKDRHNGNILLDEDGHVIHIDFGFMLSNSPGGFNFETAPFKLTRELMEVMDSDADGSASGLFDYFKVLCIQGFLACRKHYERIVQLVEIMQQSGCPCFNRGPRAIDQLVKRFHLGRKDQQCVSLVLSLIGDSLDSWRTRQYDYYQRVLNGIL